MIMDLRGAICRPVTRVNSFNRGKLATVCSRMLDMRKQVPVALEIALEHYTTQKGYTKEGYLEDLARECLYILEVETYQSLSEEETDRINNEYMAKH